MAKKDIVKVIKDANEIIGVGAAAIGLVGAAVAVAASVSNATKENRERKRIEKANKIEVPKLKGKKASISLDDHLATLKEIGLKPKKALIKPDSKYRKYSDMEVIYTEPKGGKKVNPGSIIYVYYITENIIDKSKKLYEKEKQKQEQVKKALKLTKSKEKNK